MHLPKYLSATLLAFPVLAAACSSTPDEATGQSSSELRQIMSRRQVTDGVKVASAKRGITNGLLVAGVANHETNLAHCVADYYVQQCHQSAGTPRSRSCNGGSVIVGNADPTCDDGGLGLFQIDNGTQEETIAAYGERVLELDGNTDIGIDKILGALWSCPDTPNFGADRATAYENAAAWMNGAHPGTHDYAVYFTCIAKDYNGCVGSCNTAARAAQYQSDTDALVSEFGAAYWRQPGPANPCAGASLNGKYCGSSRQNGFSGGDSSTLYTCTNGSTAAQHCANGCVVAPAGKDDFCK